MGQFCLSAGWSFSFLWEHLISTVKVWKLHVGNRAWITVGISSTPRLCCIWGPNPAAMFQPLRDTTLPPPKVMGVFSQCYFGFPVGELIYALPKHLPHRTTVSGCLLSDLPASVWQSCFTHSLKTTFSVFFPWILAELLYSILSFWSFNLNSNYLTMYY